MPEVGGDAGHYIDPHSTEDIAHAIKDIQQPDVRNALIEKGRLQRTKYSWERTANLLWTSMMHTIGNE
jgi:glycosyltransferase involved in cell wall biosynthesis